MLTGNREFNEIYEKYKNDLKISKEKRSLRGCILLRKTQR